MRNPYGPIPPDIHSEEAGHHWLYSKDYNGRFGILYVYQWQPGGEQSCL